MDNTCQMPPLIRLQKYNLESGVVLLPSSSTSISKDHQNYCSPTNLRSSKTNFSAATTVKASPIAVLLNSDPKVVEVSPSPLNSPKDSTTPTHKTKTKRRRLPAKSAASTTATNKPQPAQNTRQFQATNECFKQFYLQPQSNGTFVIVPYSVSNSATSTSSVGTKGAKLSKSQQTEKSKVSPRPETNQQTSVTICLNDDIQLKANASAIKEKQIMQIGNFKCDNSNLAGSRQDFSMMEIFAPTKLLINNNNSNYGNKMANNKQASSAFYGQLTNGSQSCQYSQPQAQHHQPSQNQQTRAILSIPSMSSSSSSASQNIDISSPPPVVSSSSSSHKQQQQQQYCNKPDDQMVNEMYSSPSFESNYFTSNDSGGGGSSLLEQNMLVASLPPVETIFNDRSISLSMASIQQPQLQQQNDDADLNMGNSFESTTIINDYHIDYFGQVDSTVDDDDDLLSNSKCLPYGYFYDNDLVFNQLKKISSLPSSTTSSPVLDSLNPFNDLFDCPANDKTEDVYNENFVDFPNDAEIEFNNEPINSNSNGSRDLNSFGPATNAHMLICDNDPLISGNNLGNNNNNNAANNNSNKENSYSKSTSLPQGSSNYAFNRSVDSLASRKGVKRMLDYESVFDSNGSSMMNDVICGSSVVDNDHSYKKCKLSSPMINKDVDGPTLAQLNLETIEEEEDDIINCLNADQDGFSNVTLPRNSSLLACGNVVDLNGQQQNLISSTSSPISKNLNQKSQNLWLQNSISTVASTSTANTVSSTILEDLTVPDVIDDVSHEIESIFQQHQQLPANSQSTTLCLNPNTSSISVNRNGGQLVSNQLNLTSPPQISSSLHLQNKLQLLQKQNLKKPNFVAPQKHEQTKLLSEILLSKNPNLNSVLRSNPININQLNLVHKQQNSNLFRNNINNQRFLINNNNAASFNKSRGKSITNCPTLTALITSPNPVSPMLSSAAMIPMLNNNITTGTNIGTILNNNNRIRNNSMSTDYSVSSHDEGFASQPDEESEESDNDNSEEIMLIQNTSDEMADNEMFYVDNNNQIINNNCSNGSLSNGSHELITATNISLPDTNSTISNVISNNNNMANCVKMEDEQIWVQNSNMMHVSQVPLKTEYETQYESTKASTSSMIDENEGEGVSSDEDDDDESFYGDYAPSDLIGATTSDDINNKWSLNMGRSRKGSEKRYFWQYNVQSKGPKGPRLGSSSSFDDEEDPHVFKEIADPVFAPDCQVEGVKHSGKARRGDGNDLTPNPKKLLMIGLELKKLSKTINDLTPVTEVPFTCRNKSRKEKNKLASRACRLKKKAQHEANKIKLYGLHKEHSKFNKIISELRKVVQIGQKMKETGSKLMFVSVDEMTYQLTSPADISPLMNEIINRFQPNMEVSGRTADFVNHILDNISAGETTGGIDNV